ncbi:hypothetical protein J437_LFUL000432 [Ladona fulva]|uniref:Cystinosin homolog n=1 Tax=Ladona fulva TaxID=123851 RepID=A0A8K0K3R1_LADFU|nr:hypothetical protein J437_LFUL000432 [Ladona fulva]
MYTSTFYSLAACILVSVLKLADCQSPLLFAQGDIGILKGEIFHLDVSVRNYSGPVGEIFFYVNHEGLVELNPKNVSLADLPDQSWTILLSGISPGHAEVVANASSKEIDTSRAFAIVTVEHSFEIGIVSQVVGWIYFAAWSVSFYPQVYINWKRKSVVGLNFDFLAFNILGFILYSVFNCGLYFIPYIEKEYSNRYPKGLNPVLMNDIFFSCHAAFATAITIIQCFIYEKGSQTISLTARGILALFFVVLIIMGSLSGANVVHWLDFLYACSYVKLTITLIKYIPQAYMNYLRKSTEGWSIGNIFCDFTGGAFSMLQMILNGYNYDDWVSIFGDPTKFGLGLFSVIFDILFFIQHYVLYRHNEPYEELNGINESTTTSVSSRTSNA